MSKRAFIKVVKYAYCPPNPPGAKILELLQDLRKSNFSMTYSQIVHEHSRFNKTFANVAK